MQLVLMLLAAVCGFCIFQQSDANGKLASSIGGSYPDAGFVSLFGSTLIGLLLYVGALLVCALLFVVAALQPCYPVPSWSYKLNLGLLLQRMWSVKRLHWWFIGSPGAVYLPVLPFAVSTIGPLPASASSVLGQMLYALYSVRRSPRHAIHAALRGLALTFAGTLLSMLATNSSVTEFSRNLNDYWLVPAMVVAGAGIMWQLTTVGQLKDGTSALAAALVSWTSGAATAAVLIGGSTLIPGMPRALPLSDWPNPLAHPGHYAGMAYGVAIIMIGAVAAIELGPVRYIVLVTAGYVLTAFGHSLAADSTTTLLIFGPLSCLTVVAGVWVTARGRQPAKQSV